MDSQLVTYCANIINKFVSNLVEKALNSCFKEGEYQEETMYLKALYELNYTFKN